MRAVRFRVRCTAFAALVAACGGGSDGTTEPPGTNNAPASLAIQAGDDQEATAGSAVPLRLSVIVRNAASQPVAGVQVTFAVTAGAGSIAANQATTNASGVATSGDWTLGSVEGLNTVSAQVSGLPPVVFRAQGRPVIRQVADTTLGTNGGTIGIDKPGDPAHGVQLIVPAQSFAGQTHVTIAVVPDLSLQLPEGLTRVGPVLQLGGFPDTYSRALLTLRIPVAVPAGSAAAAFLRHPETGRLELLSPIAQDANSITVATQHFSAALMMPSGAASAAAGPALALAQVVQVIVTQSLQSRLVQGINTGFLPGVDDWEFPNAGSYVATGGQCAGQSISAMWYFLSKKKTLGSLFGRYDDTDALWVDNPRGYRFVSIVHESIDWAAREAMFALLAGSSVVGMIPQDALTYYAMAIAMLATGEPQYVSVQDASGGHALVAYGMNAHGSTALGVRVADPNKPGEAEYIVFNGTSFAPYISSATAGDTPKSYDVIRTVGTTTMIPTASLDALWPQVTSGAIGSGIFPSYTLDYFDVLTTQWQSFADTLRIRRPDVRLRANCPSCAGGMQNGKTQFLAVFDGQGQLVTEGTTTFGASISIPTGPSRIGFFTQGDPGSQSWEYLDFQWRTLIHTPFTVLSSAQTSKVDSTVRFTARPHGDRPAQPRYRWNFGDQTAPVTINGDSVVTHKFTRSGNFTVNVELQDAATGRRVAAANTGLAVGSLDTVRVWRITRLTRQSITGDVPHDSMRNHPNAIPYGTYFDESDRFADIGAGRRVAHIHALPADTLMQDCFDLDFDFDKYEKVNWPAWIWIQFPDEVPDWCGEDRVLGHDPGTQAWHRGLGRSITLGLDQVAFYQRFQGVTIPHLWTHPGPEFAQVGANPFSGFMSGRNFSEYGTDGYQSHPVDVYVVHELTATATGRTLSGQLTFIYTSRNMSDVFATWTVVYTFDAVMGR